jgi:hypothetical protein
MDNQLRKVLRVVDVEGMVKIKDPYSSNTYQIIRL